MKKTRPITSDEAAVLTILLCLILAGAILPILLHVIDKDEARNSWTPCTEGDGKNSNPNPLLGGSQSSGYGGVASLSFSNNATRIAKSMYYNSKSPERWFFTAVFQWEEDKDEYQPLGQALPGIFQRELLEGIEEPALSCTSISGDGSTVAIGQPFGDLEHRKGDDKLPFEPLHELGNVQVFRMDKSQQQWKPLGGPALDPTLLQDMGYTLPERSHFGISTSLSSDGRRLAVGVTEVVDVDDSKNPNTQTGLPHHYSYVQVFELSEDDTHWSPLGQRIDGICSFNDRSSSTCYPCESEEFEGEITFGGTVSLSNNGRLAVGAVQGGSCGNPKAAGFVRVFDLNQNNPEESIWEQVGNDITLPELDKYDGDHMYDRLLGQSLSLSGYGNRLAVGSNAGAAVLQLSLNGEQWARVGRSLTWDEKKYYRNEKTSVSLSNDGSVVAVSGPFGSDQGTGVAAVYKWNRDDDDWKTFGRPLIEDDPWFGRVIALAPETADRLSVSSDWYSWVYNRPHHH